MLEGLAPLVSDFDGVTVLGGDRDGDDDVENEMLTELEFDPLDVIVGEAETDDVLDDECDDVGVAVPVTVDVGEIVPDCELVLDKVEVAVPLDELELDPEIVGVIEGLAPCESVGEGVPETDTTETVDDGVIEEVPVDDDDVELVAVPVLEIVGVGVSLALEERDSLIDPESVPVTDGEDPNDTLGVAVAERVDDIVDKAVTD